MADIGEEGIAVHGTVQHHRRDHAANAQASGKGRRLPMAMGYGGTASLTALGAAAQARHLGGSAGFVDEDEFAGIKRDLPLEPGLTGRFHVAALLFARMRRLFLYVMPRFLKNVQTVEGAAETEHAAKSCSAISARLMSALSSTRPRMKTS